MGLPGAHVELAQLGENRGAISKDFTENGKKGSLVLGNGLLLARDSSYPYESRYGGTKHTLDLVLDTIDYFSNIMPVSYHDHRSILTAIDLFLGYLLLDALIGNTDRHHENWGVLIRDEENQFVVELAPTFDHASSLGTTLTDRERTDRLNTRDAGRTVKAYVLRARSALYLGGTGSKPLSPLNAFMKATEFRPDAGRYWLQVVSDLNESQLVGTVERIPSELISDTARQFAIRMLECNRQNILKEQAP